MTDGILVWVQERRGGTPLLSLKYPLRHPEAETACDFPALSETLMTQLRGGQLEPDVMKQIGSSLAESLSKHPAIEHELKGVLADGGAIYLRLDPAVADDLPWEALHTPNEGFLAFNRNWPIARVKSVRRSVKTERMFVPPLKLFALLAPTGPNVPAHDEWESLYTALARSGLNLKVKVLVCDDELKSRIDKIAEKENWIECGFVPEQAELFGQIAAFEPHLIHFFCHGKASSPPFLQAGNRIDFKRNQPGSVTMEASQISQRADPNENVWLVTLDCCETALQGSDSTSRSRPFASSLVIDGVPAVIGMREPLDQAVATRFCGLFYSSFLADFKNEIKLARRQQRPAKLQWASALFAARQELCSLADKTKQVSVVAQAAKDWTIPVLYTRPETFTLTIADDPQGIAPIERPAANAPLPLHNPVNGGGGGLTLSQKLQKASELQQLTGHRDQLAGSAALPETVRGPILAEIDARIAQLQKELGA
jgi:hypothetical protein